MLIIIAIYNITYVVLSLLKQDISFFGIRFFILESNSMKPAIEQKDVEIFKRVRENELKQNDIILYMNGENIRVGRILRINENMGKTSYIVKADNRYFYDTDQLLSQNIQGKMVRKVSNGAVFLKILRSKILTVFIFIVLLFVYKLERYKRRLKDRRKKQNEKLKQQLNSL